MMPIGGQFPSGWTRLPIMPSQSTSFSDVSKQSFIWDSMCCLVFWNKIVLYRSHMYVTCLLVFLLECSQINILNCNVWSYVSYIICKTCKKDKTAVEIYKMFILNLMKRKCWAQQAIEVTYGRGIGVPTQTQTQWAEVELTGHAKSSPAI